MFGLCLGDFGTDAKISTFISFFYFFFVGAVNRCIMVEEFHYRSYLKESKLLSDRR